MSHFSPCVFPPSAPKDYITKSNIPEADRVCVGLQRKKEAHTDQPHLRTSEGDPHMSSRTSRIPWPVLAHLFAGPNLRPLSGAPLCGLFNCGEQVSRETLWFVVAEGLDFSALFFFCFLGWPRHLSPSRSRRDGIRYACTYTIAAAYFSLICDG